MLWCNFSQQHRSTPLGRTGALMTLAPLLDASPAIQVHAFSAIAAFFLGAMQLTAPKGTLPHRTFGFLWVGLMLVVCISSFWIHELRWWGEWSPIHLLVDLRADHGAARRLARPSARGATAPQGHGGGLHRRPGDRRPVSPSGPAASCMRCCSAPESGLRGALPGFGTSPAARECAGRYRSPSYWFYKDKLASLPVRFAVASRP